MTAGASDLLTHRKLSLSIAQRLALDLCVSATLWLITIRLLNHLLHGLLH